MKLPIAQFILIPLGLIGTAAHSQNIDVISEICSDTHVQSSCQETCAKACNKTAFLSAHTAYCLDNNLVGFSDPPTPDEAHCQGLFSSEDTEDGSSSDPTQAQLQSESDCDQYENRSERRRCELTKLTPACSPTVVELEGRARLLVTQIGIELSQYGELLERDWTDIDNRDALCLFSISELDEFYRVASENPENLRTLQRQATGIQACQTDWETWLRDNAGNQASDNLINQLARDAKAQLGPLKERIANLGVSVQKMESATNTIGEIIDVHIFFCDPAGSSAKE